MRIPKPWLRKSNKTWYVQINGQQIALGTGKTAAFDKYAEIMRERNLGRSVNRCSVHDIVTAYWQWFQANRATTTCETAKIILDSFQGFVPKGLKAVELRPFHIESWLKTTRVKSPSTVNHRITFLIGMMNWARRFGYIDANPIDNMDKPSPRIRQDFIPPDRFRELIGHAKKQPFRDFLTVMLDSGARTEEMFKFEAKHFDAKSRRLVLPIIDSKGKRKSRVVYLPDDAFAIVKRLARQYPEGKLFRNTRGAAWTKDSINCQFRRMKRLMKMPGLCATVLRHSFAHYRLTMGQDSLTVSKLMGHADGRMLARRYGHLEGSDYLQNAACQIGLPASSSPNLDAVSAPLAQT
jgi:integrase